MVAMVLFVLCVLVAAGFFLFRAPQETLLVGIDHPQNGATFSVNESIPVKATGFFSDGVVGIELYVDGALTGAQETTLPDGSNPLLLLVDWVPQTPGRHVLTARAYLKDDRFSDSAIVLVDVLPAPETTTINLNSVRDPGSGTCPSLAQLSTSTGISVERLLELNPSLAGTDPNAPLACDINLTGPTIPPGGGSPGGSPGGPTPGGSGTGPGGGPPPAPRVGSPAPPTGLNGSLNCREASLSWVASADATNGYVLYKLRPGARIFERTALSGSSVTATVAISAYGTYRFQVASLRGHEEGLGSIITVNTPDLCVPPAIAPGTSDIALSLISLDTSEAFDGVYCYVRAMDMPDLRLPRAEFSYMRPGADGLTYSIQRQLPNRGMFRVNLPEDGLVSLRIECWGVRGVESILLGAFTASHGRGEWDSRDLTQTAWDPSRVQVASLNQSGAESGGYNFRVVYRIGSSALADLPTLIDPALIPVLTPGMLEPIESSLNIPAPTNVRVNNIRGRLGLNVWSAELEWDWNGAPLLNESFLTGYRVRIHALDTTVSRSGDIPTLIWQGDVSPGSHKWISLPRLPTIFGCGYNLIYTVEAMVETSASPPAWFFVRNEPCRVGARIRVTFVDLRFRAINDLGDFCILCGDDGELELFGLIRAQNHYSTILGSIDPTDSCGYVVHDGEYSLDQMYFRHTVPADPGWGMRWGRYQNEFVIDISDPTQTLTISASISDKDQQPFQPCYAGADRVIEFTQELAARTPVEWQRFEQTITIGPSTIEARSGEADAGINQGSASLRIHIIGEPNTGH